MDDTNPLVEKLEYLYSVTDTAQDPDGQTAIWDTILDIEEALYGRSKDS